MEAFFVFVLVFSIAGMLFTEPGLAALVAMIAAYLLALFLFGEVVVGVAILVPGAILLAIGIVQKVTRLIKGPSHIRPHRDIPSYYWHQEWTSSLKTNPDLIRHYPPLQRALRNMVRRFSRHASKG